MEYTRFITKRKEKGHEKMNERNIKSSGSKHLGIYMTLPAVVIMLGIVIFPLMFSIYASFTDISLLNWGNHKLTGLDNYIKVFSDQAFLRAVARTMLFIIAALGIELTTGFCIALLIFRTSRNHGLLRSLLITPMMFAPVLVGFQFKWLFNDQLGLINNIIYSITGVDYGIAWLVESGLGFMSILTAEVWMNTPFFILILFAGLATLPNEPFEAATVDGAGFLQKLRYITLPLVAPYIYIALVIRSLDISRSYDLVRIMTAGGPAGRTELIWTYIHRTGLTSNNIGGSSAMSVISMAISYFTIILLYRQLNKLRGML